MTNEQLAAFYLGLVELASKASITTVDVRWHIENARDHLRTARDPVVIFDREATRHAISSFIEAATL